LPTGDRRTAAESNNATNASQLLVPPLRATIALYVTLRMDATLTPLISGMVFGIGWWLFISAHIVQSADHGGVVWDPVVYAYYYIPGIVASVALVMTNIVDVKSLNGNSFAAFASPGVSARVRAWLFLSFGLHFGAMIAGIWIMAAVFLPPGGGVQHPWPGISMMLQTVAIFIASMILLWTKSGDGNEYDTI